VGHDCNFFSDAQSRMRQVLIILRSFKGPRELSLAFVPLDNGYG